MRVLIGPRLVFMVSVLAMEAWPVSAQTDQHPVIAQNMYRLKEGRFEQIGMSWLKHGFQALALDLCCECDDPNDGSLLGVGCSDPYSASLNGDQSGFGGGGGLGPRSEVNPSTGVFAFPYMDQGQTGNAIYKRLQVRNEDLDPSLNPGALYFVEDQEHQRRHHVSRLQSNRPRQRSVAL